MAVNYTYERWRLGITMCDFCRASESFTENTTRSVPVADIELSELRTYLNNSCGTIYLIAAILNNSEPLDHVVIKAKMECPDESGESLRVIRVRQDRVYRVKIVDKSLE